MESVVDNDVLGRVTSDVEEQCHLNDSSALSASQHNSSNCDDTAQITLDEWRCMWVPSERTRAILDSLDATPNAATNVSVEHLCLPGCVLQSPLTDPVGELMRHYLRGSAAHDRSVLTADSVTQDENGVRQLLNAGCHRSAVNLSGKLLEAGGQGLGRAGQTSRHSRRSLQLWWHRFGALIRLRQFAVAGQEAEPWRDLDCVNLFCRYYDHTDRRPTPPPPVDCGDARRSLLPFGLRILLAELGRSPAALDRLHALLAGCDRLLAIVEAAGRHCEPALSLWRRRRQRVLCSLANCCLLLNHQRQALVALQQLLAAAPALFVGVTSALGRVHLQMGDLHGARRHFNAVAAAPHDADSAAAAAKRSKAAQVALNAAFLALAEGDYDAAGQQFEAVRQLEPHNAAAVSNLAVCRLYSGQLSEAIDIVERAVLADSARLLQETLLLNLCTLYELECAGCTSKKLRLLAHVGCHCGDGFNASCLKLR